MKVKKTTIKKLKEIVEQINNGICLAEEEFNYGAFLVFENATNRLNKINMNLIKEFTGELICKEGKMKSKKCEHKWYYLVKWDRFGNDGIYECEKCGLIKEIRNDVITYQDKERK